MAEEEEVKPVKVHTLKIIESHMCKSKEEAAVKIVTAAVDAHTQLMDIAHQVKVQYDKQYPGSGKATEGVYHAICGHHFASAFSLTPRKTESSLALCERVLWHCSMSES
jgi:dynein light chain LC8-type